MTLGTHAVKVRTAEMRRWEFLSSDGSLTHLRVHACTYSRQDAKYQADYVARHNEGVETKVVEL